MFCFLFFNASILKLALQMYLFEKMNEKIEEKIIKQGKT